MNGTASSFASDSENRFETLDSAADADIGYWVGSSAPPANMRGQDQPVPFDRRMTEIYRREHDQWKVVYIATLIPSNSRRERKLRNGRKFGPVQSAAEQSR